MAHADLSESSLARNLIAIKTLLAIHRKVMASKDTPREEVTVEGMVRHHIWAGGTLPSRVTTAVGVTDHLSRATTAAAVVGMDRSTSSSRDREAVGWG